MTAMAIYPGRVLNRFDLFRVLVLRQFKLLGKRSLLGLVWPVLAPWAMLALYVFVFKSVFHVPISHYTEYLYAGLLPWTFLTQALGTAVTSVSMEPELIRRAPFPYELLPISTVTTVFSFFLATLIMFIAYLAFVHQLPVLILPLLVIPLAAVFLFASGVCLLLSLVDVYSRDVRQILGNLLTIWFFLLPIVYRQNMESSHLHWMQNVDPVNMVMGQFRAVLYYGRINQPGHMALMFGICVAFFFGCLAVFRKLSPNLAKDV